MMKAILTVSVLLVGMSSFAKPLTAAQYNSQHAALEKSFKEAMRTESAPGDKGWTLSQKDKFKKMKDLEARWAKEQADAKEVARLLKQFPTLDDLTLHYDIENDRNSDSVYKTYAKVWKKSAFSTTDVRKMLSDK